jgi:hypothetical protein
MYTYIFVYIFIYQVRKLVGLTLAITRGWLPEWYLDAALNKTGMSPYPYPYPYPLTTLIPTLIPL